MNKLTIADLMKLEDYARERDGFRARVMAHKKHRRVAIGPHLTLYFEDRLTMQYQVQEMLRIERIFEADAIQEELDAYNPLIPDGSNLKATCMLEYGDVEERRQALVMLKGIEDKIWLQIGDHPKVLAIADEDLERSNDDKTSAVHFMRFELTPPMLAETQSDNPKIRFGSDHPSYDYETTIAAAAAAALVNDLASD